MIFSRSSYAFFDLSLEDSFQFFGIRVANIAYPIAKFFLPIVVRTTSIAVLGWLLRPIWTRFVLGRLIHDRPHLRPLFTTTAAVTGVIRCNRSNRNSLFLSLLLFFLYFFGKSRSRGKLLLLLHTVTAITDSFK